MDKDLKELINDWKVNWKDHLKVLAGITVILLIVYYVGYPMYIQHNIEKYAVSVVNDIFNENIKADHAKCLVVKITKKIVDNKYKAVATLDNGNDVDILITDKPDHSEIYVSMKL